MSLFRAAAPPSATRSFQLPSQFTQPSTYANVGDVTRGEAALQSIALRSTADLIASLVSELPITVYRNGRRVTNTPENLLDPGNDDTGREDWLYRLLMSWLIRGNAYGIGEDFDTSKGVPRRVELIHPDDVSARDTGKGPEWYVKGAKLTASEARDFKHWRVNPVAGRVLGLSPVEMHAKSIGVSLSSTMYGGQWFKEGGHPSGILTTDADLNDADGSKARTVKAKFMAAIHGNREPVVLGKGWKWEQIQVSPEESQFLETIGATEAQCARMFGPGFAEVMGYESGGSMTYANVADRRSDLLVFSTNKWIRRADRVLTSLLPPSTLDVRLERDAMLESTTLARYQAHALALSSKWRTVNEVRDIEDLEPVPWGDTPTQTTASQEVPPNGNVQS